MATIPDRPVLLFDGVCNLCNRSVRFVLAHEREPAMRFASLQSEVGKSLLATAGVEGNPLSTVVLIEGGRAHVRSSAALRTVRYLRAPWRWLGGLRIVPRPLRDWVYGVVSRSRYRIFGKGDVCPIPKPEQRERFLDADEREQGLP